MIPGQLQLLPSEGAEEPEQQSQKDADENAGHDGDVDMPVPSTDNDIPGQPAQAQGREKRHEQPHDQNDNSQDYEKPADI
jgi:hypothetical protein